MNLLLKCRVDTMYNRQIFPLCGIVGQTKVKKALCIVSINRKVGGLLIIGEKGSAKSTLVRSLADLLVDCQLINIPLNVSEDMVFGSLDMEYAMRSGKKRFLPGLLNRADRNMLYIDEINLLRMDLLGAIVDSSLQGYQQVEREGLSYSHLCQYSVIGTMDPEEGVLSPQMLDKFGMSVGMEKETNIENRAQVIKNVLLYEESSEQFRERYQAETLALKEKILKARACVGNIEISDAIIQLAAVYCTKANCAGHRSGIFLLEAAKTIAALQERLYVLPQDLEEAAEFVLPHRMRKNSAQSQNSEDKNNESPQQEQSKNQDSELGEEQNQEPEQEQRDFPPVDSENEGGNNDASRENEAQDNAAPNDSETSLDEENHPENAQTQMPEKVDDINRFFSSLQMKVDFPVNTKMKQGNGKRNLTKSIKQGRYVRARLPRGKVHDLAFDATLRAAAPYQNVREKTICAMHIKREDIREKVREKKVGNTFLFVVDASGSMGVKMRMKAVKGTIFTLLNDAYQKRDQVGMIAFRRDTAEVILPITRSVDLAHKCLQDLPTGGKTPLAEGLATAFETIQKIKRNESNLDPIIILLTDGRTNRNKQGGDPVEESIKMAEKFSQAQIQAVVIDTETDFIKLGIAKKIAKAMQAAYYPLEQLSKQNLLHIIKKCS